MQNHIRLVLFNQSPPNTFKGSCCPIEQPISRNSTCGLWHSLLQVFFFFLPLLQSLKLCFVMNTNQWRHQPLNPPLPPSLQTQHIWKASIDGKSKNTRDAFQQECISSQETCSIQRGQRNIDYSQHSASSWSIFLDSFPTQTPTPEAESLTCWHAVAVTMVKPRTVTWVVFNQCHMAQMHKRTCELIRKLIPKQKNTGQWNTYVKKSCMLSRFHTLNL